MTQLTISALKARYNQERADYPDDMRLRLRRALSWLEGAERYQDDDDARFIFLWIAFNAAYAGEYGDQELADWKISHKFINQLIDLDRERRLSDAVWSEFSGPIRVLLDNPHVFKPFWDFHTGRLSEEAWKDRFSQDQTAAKRALAANDTGRLLVLVFHRLRVLRNQIIHGGATWGSSVNRDQVRDCVAILGKIVPLVVLILMDNPQEPWGQPSYPVVQ